MRFLALICLALLLAAAVEGSEIGPGFVRIEGGSFKHPRSRFHATPAVVRSFSLGKFEVTQAEWVAVMQSNPSPVQDDRLPVVNVSWYDCIEYCNRRSVAEGLTPYYLVARDAPDPANENPDDNVKWTVTINRGANGYRLPTEAEWEYAAGGGQASEGRTYSGGNQADDVAWYWVNSGDAPLAGLWNWPAIEQNRNRPQPVGRKAPNELGLHDMSGNVREWCWDWYAEAGAPGSETSEAARGALRVWKGGGWIGADFCCEPSFRAGFEPHSRGADQGFRVCRDA